VEMSLVHEVVLLRWPSGARRWERVSATGVCSSVRTRAGQPGPPTIASAPGGSNRPPGCRGILFRGFRVVSEAWRQTCEAS
jgi:hypothetical protein